jgi:uncharacterized membrane protein YuzA (DUF378 family)
MTWFEEFKAIVERLSRSDQELVAIVILGVGIILWGLCTYLYDIVAGVFEKRRILSEAEKPLLGFGAVYHLIHGYKNRDLEGKRPSGRWWQRRLLREDWDVKGKNAEERRESALEALERLREYGHRNDPECQQRALAQLRDEGAAARALFAWDVTRLAFIARVCYFAGYIDEATTFRYLRTAAAMAGRSFRSWEQFGRAFVQGREAWGERQEQNVVYTQMVDKLLAKQDSQWNRYSFQDALRA